MAIKRICLVYAGGTITGVREQVGGSVRIKQPKTHVELLASLRELEHLQEFALPGGTADGPGNLTEDRIVFYKAVDSTNCVPQDWLEIASLIYERKDQYDGFVVTHGTDTMIYTASALAFLLKGLNKPVVLTGAQLPLVGELVTDARDNLLNAFRVAAQDIGEVAICFGRNVVRGTRARKVSEFEGDAFTSTEVPLVGRIGIRILVDDKVVQRSKPVTLGALDLRWEKRVALVKLYPGMTPATLRSLLFSGLRGVVLEGFGAGNIPDRAAGPEYFLLEPIREAIRQNIMVVVCPQVPIGRGDIFQTTSTEYLAAGVINAYDMVPEVALTKLMWVLGRTTPTDEASRLAVAAHMQTPVAGEIVAEVSQG